MADKVNWDTVTGTVVALSIASAVVAALFVSGLASGPKLDVVVAAEATDPALPAEEAGWTLTGLVLNDGAPAADVAVWAIASDNRGNRFSPEADVDAATGAFAMDSVPRTISGDEQSPVTEIAVFARSTVEGEEIRGQTIINFGAEGAVRKVPLPLNALLFIPALFGASILLGLIKLPADTLRLKLKYFAVVGLAFGFTLLMIGFMAIGYQFVTASDAGVKVLSLGFANLYQGSYVADVAPEWLFSLTSPASLSPEVAGEAPPLAQGFGAPLWVLFLSVLGAGVFVVVVILNDIKTSVPFHDAKAVRARTHKLIGHQFYVLFAPLGAIFVYQLLLVAEAASQQITVALAALAAGLTLNLILDRALRLAKGALNGEDPAPAAAVAAQPPPAGGGAAPAAPVAAQPQPAAGGAAPGAPAADQPPPTGGGGGTGGA